MIEGRVMTLLNSLAQIQVLPGDVKIPQNDLGQGQLRSALQIAFGIGGALAVLIIVVAGLRFVTARGDPQAVSRARNSVIYAVVGLVVCAMGFAIVTFVVDNI